MSSTILIERQGSVGYLVLNRPAKLNSITEKMVTDFGLALSELESDPDVRVIVVRGAGTSFCTGYDLDESIDAFLRLGLEEDLEWIEWQEQTFEQLWRCKKPTIAQVHGYCYAGGGIVAGFCDIIVAADDAQFGQTQRIGYPPELCLWPITIGPRKTKELLFAGASVSGTQAHEMGMVNHAVPLDELEGFVQKLAGEIALTDPQILRYQKRLINQIYDQMGFREMINAGVLMDVLGHRSNAMQNFVRVRDEQGLRAAISLRTHSPDKRPDPSTTADS
ncbi:enoyl-CoA hydratase-related protein [Rhodococcus sp. NPDC057014]|uniref:enoyl-CoA hydratase-related protein n=1 Tax=unclassified Rhodococcus (in: high G+C Gram-positive bacteria) TaxID=192944 RepID=UPI0023E1A1C9|nr:enoyl-CoA hydratase-related protein [Rhodococcus sp. T2V]MDF3311861.1 enoyl-CoA hydratase-related protein [Rhodococcus sp. T2V]